MGRKSNIDWILGRNLYTQQGYTMAQVADALTVTTRAVQRHATAENWKGARADFTTKTVILADAQGSQQAADDLIKTRVSLTDSLPALNQAVYASLALINARLTLAITQPNTLSFGALTDLLTAVADIILKQAMPAASPETNTMNILVQLQALGAAGRVDVYKQLAD